MPYMCIVGGHRYVNGEVDGCHDESCLAFARKEIRPVGIHVAGFAGSAVTKIARKNYKQFHKDMYKFKDAVDQGVKPEQVTAKAAEIALKRAEAAA